MVSFNESELQIYDINSFNTSDTGVDAITKFINQDGEKILFCLKPSQDLFAMWTQLSDDAKAVMAERLKLIRAYGYGSFNCSKLRTKVVSDDGKESFDPVTDKYIQEMFASFGEYHRVEAFPVYGSNNSCYSRSAEGVPDLAVNGAFYRVLDEASNVILSEITVAWDNMLIESNLIPNLIPNLRKIVDDVDYWKNMTTKQFFERYGSNGEAAKLIPNNPLVGAAWETIYSRKFKLMCKLLDAHAAGIRQFCFCDPSTILAMLGFFDQYAIREVVFGFNDAGYTAYEHVPGASGVYYVAPNDSKAAIGSMAQILADLISPESQTKPE